MRGLATGANSIQRRLGRLPSASGAALVAAALMLAGCATSTGSLSGFSIGESDVATGGFESGGGLGAPSEPESSAAAGERAFSGRVEPAPAPMPQPLSADTTAAAATAAAATLAAPQLVPRLRVYSAHVVLVVDNVAAAKRQVIGVAEQVGGLVESSFADQVVVRVPAAEFDAALEQIETHGRVQSRAVATSDVTERIQDLNARLRVARQTHERLSLLLQRTDDAQERVRILSELRRLAEQIDQMEITLASLQGQVAMSRITVQLFSRIEQDAVSRDAIPFRWMAELEPLRITLPAAPSGWAPEVGEGYAIFEGDRFVAESAEGTRLRVGATDNEPRGDADYWQRALEYHLGPLYERVDPVTTGDFRGVLLESKDREPFHYLIAARVAGDQLIVAEAFFPDAAALQRRRGDFERALAQVVVP